eukprot:TRINITY_DN74330_c0_g1_i1.p1 TRINITY_DN74330_c0_g1~~TRINITY_DN74330_c0_g1_i1.p1  ORF type:complete len:918 (-),score=123.37 TRINITY_DN74330_c0_g1_i1:135-2828(-)
MVRSVNMLVLLEALLLLPCTGAIAGARTCTAGMSACTAGMSFMQVHRSQRNKWGWPFPVQKTTVTTTSLPAASDFEAVDGGAGRACRGANSSDNMLAYYERLSKDTLDGCKEACRHTRACKGIEFHEATHRCEVWVRPDGIAASVTAADYVCFRYMPASLASTTLARTTVSTSALTTTAYVATTGRHSRDDSSECKQFLHIERDGRWTPESASTFCHDGTPPDSSVSLPATWFQENCVRSCAKPAVSAIEPMCPSCCKSAVLGVFCWSSGYRQVVRLSSGRSCCCPAGVGREVDCVGSSAASTIFCPRGGGGGGGTTQEYLPARLIRSAAEVNPGFATEHYPGLPGIPYVSSKDDAAGNNIRADLLSMAARLKTGLTVSTGATTNVTIGNKTQQASEWFGTDTILEHPDQFAIFRKSHVPGHVTDNLPDVVDNPRRFEDTQYATDVWFHEVVGRSVVAFNAPLALSKIKSIDIGDITQELDNRVTVDTSMYWLDLRDMDNAPAQSEIGRRTKYAVGAVVLLKFGQSSDGSKVLHPVAIRLGTTVDGSFHKAVFVRGQSSESAWRFALLGAACSFSQVAVAILHIFAYHVEGANFQWHFYNHLSPSHRLHNALQYMTKYTVEFNTHVLLNQMPLRAFPYHNIKRDQKFFLPVFAGWERLAQRFPYYTLLPSLYLAEHGIAKEYFSVVTDWDLLPIAKFQLACEQAAAKFVGSLVDYYYKTEAEVQNDTQLQTFIAAMQDPGRGNVRVTESGDVSTTSELKQFLTVYMFGTIVHGGARMRQYTFQGTLVPSFIASFMDPELMMESDVAEYSLSQMMRAMPDTRVLGDMSLFVAIFEDVKPMESAFPNSRIDSAALPYDCGVLNNIWLEVLATLKEIFQEGYYFQSPASDISQWPRNQEA